MPQQSQLPQLHGLRAGLYGEPWMIDSLLSLASHADQIEAAAHRAAAGDFKVQIVPVGPLYEIMGNGLAIIDVVGVITRRASIFTSLFGGAPMDALHAAIDEADADDSVNEIYLRFDSPGGSVNGIFAAAARLRDYSATRDKPLKAFVENALSAAYLLAVNTDEIIIQPGGSAGSIGVIAQIPDATRLEKNLGIDTSIFRSAPGKAPGTGPMTDTAAEAITARVQDLFSRFRASVDTARPVDIDAVSTGATWLDHDAVDMGLADRVATFEQILAE
jgi:ClpP class serine protease